MNAPLFFISEKHLCVNLYLRERDLAGFIDG
jgi:hypothetical protein